MTPKVKTSTLRLLFYCFFLTLTLGMVGCSQDSTASVRLKKTDTPVCVLNASFRDDNTSLYETVLKEVFPDAPQFNANDWQSAFSYCRSNNAVLVLPQAEYLGITLWKPIRSYIYEGGHVLFWSPSPASARVLPYQGQMMPTAAWHKELIEGSHAISNLPPINVWSHRFDQSIRHTRVMAVDSPNPAMTASAVESEDYDHFDALMVSIPNHNLGQTDALCFYAKGEYNTTQLAVYCTDIQGHTWTFRFPVSTMWTPIIAHKTLFESKTGSRSQEAFDFSNVQSIAIGLFNDIAPQLPGRHRYELTDIRTVSTAIPQRYVKDILDLPPFFEPALITLQTNSQFSLFSDREMHLAQPTVYGTLPALSRSWLHSNTVSARIRPLATTSDNTLMSAALLTGISPENHGIKWGWLGIPPPRQQTDLFHVFLGQMIEAINTPHLLNVRPNHYVCDLQTPLELTTWLSIDSVSGSPDKFRLIGELLDQEGRILRRLGPKVTHYTNNIYTAQLQFGNTPNVSVKQEITIAIQIEERSADGKILDRQLLPIKIHPTPTISEMDLQTSGSRFVKNRRTTFITCINYTPPFNCWIPSDSTNSFLTKDYFVPDRIKRDLDLLREADINTALFTINRLDEADAYLFIADELLSKDMMSAIYLPQLKPDMNPKLTTLIKEHVDQLNLTDNTTSILFLPPPDPKSFFDSALMEKEWNRWLIDQYGSAAKAKKSMAISRLVTGENIPVPDRAVLLTDGVHRIHAAVFRRFVNDWLSKRYGFIIQHLRQWGCKQLISVLPQASFEESGIPFDITTAAHHFDFITASASSLGYASSNQVLSAGFITAYARGSTGTVKPVLWSDCGVQVGRSPRPPDLTNQTRVFDTLFTMFYESLSAGMIGDTYSVTVNEIDKDKGLISYQDLWRPVRLAFQRHYRRLKNNMLFPAPWQGRYFQGSIDARGLTGLWDRWQHVYLNETKLHNFTEIRPFGFDSTTENMPTLAVGGIPHRDPAPFETVNAEWGQPHINGNFHTRFPDESIMMTEGEDLLIPLINSGLTSWIPYQRGLKGSVCITAVHESGTRKTIPVPVVSAGDQFQLQWYTAQKGQWILRPRILGKGSFGEPLTIIVQANPKNKSLHQ